VKVSQEKHVEALAKPAGREVADHLHGQPGLVLEVGPAQSRLDFPNETVRRFPREEVDRGAREAILRDRAPESVGPVLLVQQVAMGQ
jgi:hypothetical protein